MKALVPLWPTLDAQMGVLKTDAEAASRAVVLAVHQPMQFLRRAIGARPGDHDRVDETGVLEALLADNSNGRVIVPIVGASGAGKSHVIRWLGIQLESQKDHEKRVLVRIPKGRSLKGVLSDILDRFTGSAYDQYRKDLKKARDRIEPKEAAHLLCERLAHAVERMAEAATQRAQGGKKGATDHDDVARAFGAKQMLPTLLRCQELREQHFVGDGSAGSGVIGKLIAQLHIERRSSEADDREHQFVADDFLFSPKIERKELSRDVQKAMGKVETDTNRARVAELLNSALDQAKQDLLGLSSTVTDLFLDVRRQILAEKKELVLLVEDFAVLSGLQGQLLQVMIQEASRDGKQELCVMRTALAYTDGYMHTDTVLTRAGHEFIIPPADDSHAVTMSRINGLVAAYLNAARVGQHRLEAAEKKREGSSSKKTWIPSAEEPDDEESQKALDSFGRHSNIPLFPFNRSAITALAIEGCQHNGKLTYNPRFVIQNVLLRVLEHRSVFQADKFPEATFKGATSPLQPVASLGEWVRRQGLPPPVQQRLMTFLSYWGHDIETVEGLAQLWPVLRCFRVVEAAVAPATTATKTPLQQVPTTASPSPPTKPPPPPLPQSDAATAVRGGSPLRLALEKWRNGEELGEVNARQLRKEVFATAIEGAIDFDWLACRRDERDPWWERTMFARAASSFTQPNPSCVIVSDDEYADEIVRGTRALELAALADAADRGWTWDFDSSGTEPSAEDELIRASVMVERHAGTVRDFVAERPFGLQWSPIETLVRALTVGAQLFQLPGTEASSPVGRIAALFEAGPRLPDASANDPWSQVQRAASEIRHSTAPSESDSWIALLLEEVGARQGGKGKIQAIDAAKLKVALDAVLTDWCLVLTEPRGLTVSQRNKPGMRLLLRDEVVRPLRGLDAALESESTRQRTWLTAHLAECDNDKLFAIFRDELTAELAQLAVNHGTSFRDLAAEGRTLDATAIEATIQNAARLGETKDASERLKVAGMRVRELQAASASWLARVSAAARELDVRLDRQTPATQQPLEAAASAVAASVKELRAALEAGSR